MKPNILQVLFAAFLLSATTVSAQPYIGANIGSSITTDSNLSQNNMLPSTISYNTGLMLSGIAGLDFGIVRGELEVGYRNSDINEFSQAGIKRVVSGSADLMNYMINGYVVAPFVFPVKPFVMAGFGLASMHTGEVKEVDLPNRPSATNTQFAYQVGLGVTYDVLNLIALDAGYRYLGASDFDLNGTKAGYGNHNFLLGCRYYF
jgi:opacity protein-like surface antigen